MTQTNQHKSIKICMFICFLNSAEQQFICFYKLFRQYIVNKLKRAKMRKGHRRTQSAYIASSNQQMHNPTKGVVHPNQIVKLIEASENKIESKVINYQRLQVSSLQQNNFLKFGNFSIVKANSKPVQAKPSLQARQSNFNLNCIPENSKSSQISSQRLQKQGLRREDQIPIIPIRRAKQKRASDFKRLQIERNQKQIQESSFSGKRSRLGKSLKKK